MQSAADHDAGFASPIQCERLWLIPATALHLASELDGNAAFAALLDAEVPASWPPGEYDRPAQEYFHKALTAGGDAVTGWYGWYALTSRPSDSPLHQSRARTVLVGCGGYFGPPTEDGVVEIGYSVCSEFQRRGYATELARALVRHVRHHAAPARIVAHTHEDNVASVAVLERSGFVRAAKSDRRDALLFEWREVPRA